MLYKEIVDIINDIHYPEYIFELEDHKGTFLLSAYYYEQDIHTAKNEIQRTRKWFISEFACRSEIVQTCLKCILTSMEHRVREHFTYIGMWKLSLIKNALKGKLPFGPHWNVETLTNMADGTHTESRK